jgi:hypothetical protein
VLGRSGECSNQNPKEGAFSLREIKKERKEMAYCGLGRRKEGSRHISS